MARPDYSTAHRPLSRRALLRGAFAWTASAATSAAVAAGAIGGRVETAPAVQPGAAPEPRWWSSLVWAVFENRTFDQTAALPSHRRLAAEGTVLARYFAVAHPSGPNYRAMASGETWGRAEIVDTFHPSIASVGAAARPPVPTFVYHLAGEIARRHNPFVDLRAPVARTRRGLDAFRSDVAGGPTGLPDGCLVYVGWDDDNNLHNGHRGRADANLIALLDVLARSPWFTTPDAAGRYPALFFCYDEDDGGVENRVFAAFWGRGVRRGAASEIRHTHYGFCRTLSDNWNLPLLGKAVNEGPIAEVWT